jgi:hypothetical protein
LMGVPAPTRATLRTFKMNVVFTFGSPGKKQPHCIRTFIGHFVN